MVTIILKTHNSDLSRVTGTNKAISLTQDVITYNVKRGNPVFACSLDAEGAFDAIPFEVLFHKAAGVLSEGS